MKNIILITLLLISTNYFAQDKVIVKSEAVNEQTNNWMTNIATNSQLRLDMMQMMIEQTVTNPDEMQLLVNQILNNSEMKTMIRKSSFQENNAKTKPEIDNKYNDIMKRTETHQKPKIKN